MAYSFSHKQEVALGNPGDIIAHHYFDIDAEEIFEVIHHELSPLLNSIQRFIDQLSDTGNESYG